MHKNRKKNYWMDLLEGEAKSNRNKLVSAFLISGWMGEYQFLPHKKKKIIKKKNRKNIKEPLLKL